MMAFLLQALLWLVATFLLGFAISRFLKSLFCRDNPTQEIYSGGMTAPPVDTAIPRTSVAAKTATVLGGAAVAAGAVTAARHKTTTDLPDADVAVKAPAVPTLDFSNIDPHKPIIDPPDVDWISNIDPHKPIIDPPDVEIGLPDMELPEVSLPSVDINLPKVDLQAPRAEIDLPDVSLPLVDVELPDVAVKTPEVVVEADSGTDLWDVAKGAVVAAGAGLAAKAASAFDFSGIDPHKPIIELPDVDWISNIDPHKPIIDPPNVEIGLPDRELPEVSLPSVDINLPKVDLQAPHAEIDLPDVSLPSVDVELPDMPKVAAPVDLTAPQLEVDLPDLGLPEVSLPSVDVELPDVAVKTPEVAVEADSGTDLWDVAKGAIVAAGAGLAAKAASALDFSGIDPHKPIIDPPDVDWISNIDPHKPIVDPPDVEIGLPDRELPEVSLPSVDINLPKVDLQAPHAEIDLPDVSLPSVDVELPDVAVKTPEVAVEADSGTDLWNVAKGAVVAAGAGLAAKAASALDFSGIDPHKPIIDPPDVDWISNIDPHKPIVDPPDVEIGLPDRELPEVSLPSVDINLPKVDLQAPHAEIDLPDVSLPSVDVELPDVAVKTPEVAVEADGGTDLWDVAKGAIVAAGAGLAAKAASAFDFSGIDPHKPIIDPPDLQADMPDTLVMTGDWLHDLVARIRAAYHGKHLRMVSRLWDANAGYDCSSLGEEYEALDLTASQYDRMGVFHCGVTRDGFVSVGGDVATLAVGEAVLFHYPNIVVCRHADEEYRFIRIAV